MLDAGAKACYSEDKTTAECLGNDSERSDRQEGREAPMRTEQGKRKWVKAYLYVKFAELVAFAVVVVGAGIVTSMHMDPAMFWPVLRALLCAAYIWEMRQGFASECQA